MATIPLAPIDAVRITILMDNLTDPLIFPSENVERTTWLHQLARPRMPSAVTAEGLLGPRPSHDRRARADDPLRRGCHSHRGGGEHASARAHAEGRRGDRPESR